MIDSITIGDVTATLKKNNKISLQFSTPIDENTMWEMGRLAAHYIEEKKREEKKNKRGLPKH